MPCSARTGLRIPFGKASRRIFSARRGAFRVKPGMTPAQSWTFCKGWATKHGREKAQLCPKGIFLRPLLGALGHPLGQHAAQHSIGAELLDHALEQFRGGLGIG